MTCKRVLSDIDFIDDPDGLQSIIDAAQKRIRFLEEARDVTIPLNVVFSSFQDDGSTPSNNVSIVDFREQPLHIKLLLDGQMPDIDLLEPKNDDDLNWCTCEDEVLADGVAAVTIRHILILPDADDGMLFSRDDNCFVVFFYDEGIFHAFSSRVGMEKLPSIDDLRKNYKDADFDWIPYHCDPRDNRENYIAYKNWEFV